MIHPIKAVSAYYQKHNILPLETIQYMEYSMLSIFNEWIKILVYWILFFLLERDKQFWFILTILYPIRWISGGIHAKTFWGCFSSSLIAIALLIYLAPQLICLPYLFSFFLFSLGIGSIHHVPYTPAFRPIKNARIIRTLRCFYICLLTAWILALNWCNWPMEYVSIGFYTLFFQVIQLYIPKKGGLSHV